MKKPERSVLVTGAGSGMGLETAVFLAEQGRYVFGTVVDPGQEKLLLDTARQKGVIVAPVKMDLTDQDSVDAGVDKVLARGKGIEALVHFAGIGLRGFFEDLDLEEIRAVHEVNLFGTMRITRAVLPLMRRARRGRILLTSSIAGRIGSMSLAGYASSKFAIEGFAECLAQEVSPLGIKVTLLEPGLIRTPHFTVHRNRARKACDPRSPYYAWFCQHEKLVDDLLSKQSFSECDVARLVHKVLGKRRPRLRYVVGRKARFVVGLRSFLPGPVFERFYFGLVRRLVVSPRHPARGLSGLDQPAQESAGRTQKAGRDDRREGV